MALADVRGHQAQALQIRTALFGERPGHAYLFAGPDGVGKAFFALQAAKLLLCENAKEDACDYCRSCRQIDHDNHPDLHLVQPEEGKRFISIEQVQQLCGQYSLHPHGARRVAVLRDADRMTLEAANALLKTLEEPPPWGLLVLTTSRPDGLPETILSRCQTLRFGPLAREDVLQVLAEHAEWTPEEARFAATLADGSVGRALTLLESGGVDLRDRLVERLRRLRSQDNFDFLAEIEAATSQAKGTLEDQRERLRLVLQIMLRYYRDVWTVQLGAGEQRLFNAGRLDDVRADAERLAAPRVEQIIELLTDTWQQVNRNVNLQLLLESVLFRLGLALQTA